MASRTTRSHEEIKKWAEAHGACPSIVSRTGGMLRFEFDPERAQELTPVEWDDFLMVFDEKGLELVYDDKPESRFHKFVYPETVEAKAEHRAPQKPARASRRLQIVGGKHAGASAASGRSRKTAAGRKKNGNEKATTSRQRGATGASRKAGRTAGKKSRRARPAA